MALSKQTTEFIDNLIDYYISESESYVDIAKDYVPEVDSVYDTAFGIIVGCVYSAFLQTYLNQHKTASNEDIMEFNSIMKKRAPLIKKSIIENKQKASLKN